MCLNSLLLKMFTGHYDACRLSFLWECDVILLQFPCDCLTLAKSYRGEADFSLFSLHKFMAHFGSILRREKKGKY